MFYGNIYVLTNDQPKNNYLQSSRFLVSSVWVNSFSLHIYGYSSESLNHRPRNMDGVDLRRFVVAVNIKVESIRNNILL